MEVRMPRLAAFVRGLGQSRVDSVEKAVYIAKQTHGLRFYKSIDDYKFYPASHDIFSPSVRTDLGELDQKLVEGPQGEILTRGDFREFFEAARRLAKFKDEDLRLAAQILWNNGNDLKEIERKKGRNLIRKLRKS